ncbi:MAG TPA: nucleotidyltransferase [Polyangiaceae bacterium]
MLPDWIELCRLFNEHRVEYLLVGGQAVIAHGYPRLTKDMDLWVRPSLENGQRVLLALSEFGTPLADFDAEKLTDPRTLLMLGRDPFRIDILTDIPGIDFDGAWLHRSSVTLDGQAIPLISAVDLIANKIASGRLQDLADVEALRAVQQREQ